MRACGRGEARSLLVSVSQSSHLVSRHTHTVDSFAFEAYNAPVGGVLDTDSSGTTVAFMSKFVQEAYCGVLQVLPSPAPPCGEPY